MKNVNHLKTVLFGILIILGYVFFLGFILGGFWDPRIIGIFAALLFADIFAFGMFVNIWLGLLCCVPFIGAALFYTVKVFG